MTLRAEVTLEWADGEYLFALKAKQIEELQSKCGAGFGEIYQRVMGGEWYLKDLTETIRLGLIGGGMGAVDAKRMVDAYVDGQPIAPGTPDCPLMVAQAVLLAAVMGVDTLAGKKPMDSLMAGLTSGIGARPS